MLHLKTGVNYLENNLCLVYGEFTNKEEFSETKFDRIVVDDDEAYAANCLWLNGTVLVPTGFPKTKEAIQKKGIPIKLVDVSEFAKLDGGLSCLSLWF